MDLLWLHVAHQCTNCHAAVQLVLRKRAHPKSEARRTGKNCPLPHRSPVHNNFTGTYRHCYNDLPNGQEVTLPLYEYRCEKCGARVEKIQKFSDPPLATCEKCGGELTRLLSAPAIQFKGTGWYVTDYARKTTSGQASKSESGPSTTPAPSSGSSSSESKSSGSKTSVNK